MVTVTNQADNITASAKTFIFNKDTHTPPSYGHYTGQSALASSPVGNWRIWLLQSFTGCMPLLVVT